jgi:hypothetical protein
MKGGAMREEGTGNVQFRAAMACLASNLAIAGGLCEAFDQGYEQREHEHLYSNHGYRTEQDWRPGCNQPHRSGR